jgi:hypothetical protein
MQRSPRTACLASIFGTQALTLPGRLSLNNEISGSEEAAIRLPKRLRSASSWGCPETALIGQFKESLTSCNQSGTAQSLLLQARLNIRPALEQKRIAIADELLI